MKSENSLTGKVAAFQKTGGHVPGRVLLTLSQVIAKTSLGRSAIYAAMDGTTDSFPRPVKLGNRRVAWLLDDVEAYIDQRLSEPTGRKHGLNAFTDHQPTFNQAIRVQFDRSAAGAAQHAAP